MAKHNITMNCGCTETHDIGGPVRQRDYKAKRIAEDDCGTCYRERKHAEALAATPASWPVLTGTEKQVKWAMSIRAEGVKAIHEWLENDLPQMAAASGMERIEAITEGALWYGSVEELVQHETTAKYWIDNRPFTSAYRWGQELKPYLAAAGAQTEMR